MDAFSKGTYRRLKKSGILSRIFIREEHKRLLRYENLIFDYFDNHTIISGQDRDSIRHAKKKSIEIVPNGIDKEFFQSQKIPKTTEVLFTGNMNYPPNMDSALYIVNEIMPIVWKTMPEAKVKIAGVTNSFRILSLQSDRVSVTGWVDDIRTAYDSAMVFLAPMNMGSGLQNKLLEAMSMNLPCITSDLANNALHAIENEDILIGRSTEDYAQKVINLLKDKERAAQLGEKGRNFVVANYNWKSSTDILEKLIISTYEA